MLFFDREDACWNLVEGIRCIKDTDISPCSLEYFDRFSLMLLRDNYPNIPEGAQAALFFEQNLESEDQFELGLESWYRFLNQQDLLLDDSWFANSPKDLETFHQFRHALPLLLNEENSKLGRVKIGTDMAVEDEYFMEMMKFYRGNAGFQWNRLCGVWSYR